MASANFLEEALKSDVDESAVSAIVGTLENQLDQSSTTQVQQVGKNFECGNSGNSFTSAIVSNGGTTPIYSTVQQQQQKHSNHGGVTNGEIVSNVMNSNGSNNNNNNNSKTFIIATSGGQNVITSSASGPTTVVVGKNITVSATGIPPPSTPPALMSTVPTSTTGINIISNQIVVSAGGQHPPPFNVTNNNNNPHHQSNMPKNEPVKLVYPAPGGGAGTQAVINMNNNRVTLTSTALPNGTISLSQAPQLIQTGSVAGKTTIQATGPQGNQGQSQPQTLIIKNQQTGAVMNSGAPGIVTMSKPINNQNIVGLPAGVQIVNVRPGAPPTQAQQKTVAAVSPRVVIGSQQIVSTRPPNANAITLSALQGQPGSTLLLKNEQGQFQLLRIGPAPSGAQITPANITATSATNQTIRLQTVPAVSRFTGPPLALRKTIVTTQQVKQKQNQPISSGSGTIIVNSQSITTTPTSYVTTQSTPVASVAPVPALAAQQHITISTAPSQAQSHVTGQPTVVSTQQAQVVVTSQQQQQQQQQPQQTVVVTTTTGGQTAQQRNSLDNTKEKCRKFLTNLIELSKREPKPVEKNVRTLIQELVDANVEPEEFCERLERLLNASPQPCLIGFLKKSLPLLRQSLVTKEITIEGINPPSANVAFSGSPLTQIPAQIRPVTQPIITQNSMVGQTQIRMLTTQSGATTIPRIGQTTIRPATTVRIPTPISQQAQQHTTLTASGPRHITAQQIRPNATVGHTTIVQTNQQLPQTISTTPPALLPIRAPAGTAITRTPATLQIRATTPVVSRAAAAAASNSIISGNTTVTAKTIRSQTPAVASVAAAAAAAAAAASGSAATQVKQVTAISNSNVVVAATSVVATSTTASGAPGLVVTGTQPLPALALSSSAAAAVATLNNASNSNNSTSIISTSFPPATTVVVSSVPSSSTNSSNNSSGTTASTPTTIVTGGKASAGTKSSSGGAKKKASASSAASAIDSADPTAAVKKAAASMQSSFYQHHVSSSMYGDDDINDVAAMGGVNLAEETQRILGSTEFVGTQIRSCKDEVFLHMPALQAKIRSIIARHGLEEPSSEVAVLISHACQERLKNIVEKLAVIAEHRIDIIKVDPRYEVTKDVRGQIKFLEELDKAEQKRHEEQEREMLMRAAKSRSKTEDPEQAKLKAKAKEMQRAEMEELRQRDANLTALQAIGPRKKPKLEEGVTATVTPGASGIGAASGKASTPLRPRIKRVNLRDMLFYLEQEKESCRSQMLYKAYLK
ncbi:transcription initiation factor TFIID subunit 4 isoform X2 [Topomyia yanbarensis]|uniref:transcription initiation factor TFIID subunit 4 isoform X2 n=1 Tax=Topomyia yanbarensis TaxID=2498891 RepID=UPI00273CB6D4|nr:transcription initiation factor TFIID subunit 4 isoform X2 [Topomyia yanbarensis]